MSSIGNNFEVSDQLYQELKGCANRILANQSNITIQTTEMVHEACMLLIENKGVYNNKEHLYRTAAKTMRRLLIDHARAKSSMKRSGNALRTQWLDELLDEEDENIGLLVIEECISQMAKLGNRLEAIVELHYFAGFAQQKVADVLSLSLRTVERELTFARAFMHEQLQTND